MIFINKTGNSIHLEDINLNIPFLGDESQSIDLVDVKKSEAFQKMAVLGAFEILTTSGSRLEKNILRMLSEHQQKPKQEVIEENMMLSGDKAEVVIKGHFYEAGGYAKVNRNLALGLAKLGVGVEIKPVSMRRNDLNEMEVRLLGNLKRPVGRSAIKIDSIIPSFTDVSPRSSYRVLYTTIEATTVPQQTVDICNQYDEIWVTSDFCKDILSKYKIKPQILVFPSTTNTSLYNENAKPHVFTPPLNKFVFLSVFGWSYRKGYDALLRSYIEEFSSDEDVSLLIVSRFQGASERSKIIQEEVRKYLERYGGQDAPHISRCSRVINESEMPRIYRACNAFVLPSRGEGFGLPYVEASLCGLPVISTRHGGQLMFLNDNNSHLVDIDRMEPMRRGKMHVHYWDNEIFPALDSDEFIGNLRNAMRDVYCNYSSATSANKSLQDDLKKNYSVLSVCGRIKQRLNDIWTSVQGVKI